MARSRALEGEGKVDQALELLEPLRPQYPQDYALLLRLGWLSFSAGYYPQAEDYYRGAHALSNGSVAARHGLAWALQRQGKKDDARTLFRWVLAIQPKNETARKGLALCPEDPLLSLTPSASFMGHIYKDHYLYNYALGARFALPWVIREHFLLSPVYRFQRFSIDSESGATGAAEEDFSQHELYVSAGALFPAFSIIAQYGWVNVSSDSVEDGHILGLSGRYSPYGDITLSGSASLYSDMNVYRLAAA